MSYLSSYPFADFGHERRGFTFLRELQNRGKVLELLKAIVPRPELAGLMAASVRYPADRLASLASGAESKRLGRDIEKTSFLKFYLDIRQMCPRRSNKQRVRTPEIPKPGAARHGRVLVLRSASGR
jgi:hypothetical protein